MRPAYDTPFCTQQPCTVLAASMDLVQEVEVFETCGHPRNPDKLPTADFVWTAKTGDDQGISAAFPHPRALKPCLLPKPETAAQSPKRFGAKNNRPIDQGLPANHPEQEKTIIPRLHTHQ